MLRTAKTRLASTSQYLYRKNMTKDEALRLALEALKEDRAWLETDAPTEVWEKNNEAITAIKAALEANNEPVAYLCENAVGHRYFRWKKPTSTYKPIPLYTAQLQRTWVGLTYEDMVKLQKDLYDAKGESVLPTTFAMAVEAKLKEKNT
jgi:hypothetical protein